MKTKRAVESRRYRFSVPENDELVHEWLAAQADPSHSLRILIQRAVQNDGIRDIACLDVSKAPKRPGRKRKAVPTSLEQTLSAGGYQMEPKQAPVKVEPAVPVLQPSVSASVPDDDEPMPFANLKRLQETPEPGFGATEDDMLAMLRHRNHA